MSIDETYKNLVKEILETGTIKGDRTGTGTISIFGKQITHKMSSGFPLLTTKKLHWDSITTELVWFLRGDTNIKYLVDRKCNIWNNDAYNYYLKVREAWMNTKAKNSIEQLLIPNPLSKEDFILGVKTAEPDESHFGCGYKYGDLGPIYGKQWRSWTNYTGDKPIDQIKQLIYDLENNPDSRRLMVNAWNVSELPKMGLPPCHYGFECNTRLLTPKERYRIWFDNNYETGFEYDETKADETDYDAYFTKTPTRALSLSWHQRSVDTFLGLPFNIASYGLLLLILANHVGMYPENLIGNLGDTHLYLNHIEQAKELISREPFQLPRVIINDEFWNPENVLDHDFIRMINIMEPYDFQLIDYVAHPTIKAPLSN